MSRLCYLAVLLVLVGNSYSTPVTPQQAVSSGPSCTCETEKSWNDVMFLFDTSSNTGNNALQMLLVYVQSSMAWFNVQKSNYQEQFHTRIGIISYGNNATLLAPLGSVDGSDLTTFQIPYSGDDNTNLVSAMQLAMLQFEGPNRRKNARRVMVVLSTGFVGANADVMRLVNDFWIDNGISVVYDLQIGSDGVSSTLQAVASPGYFIKSREDKNGDKLKEALCNANCFCPGGYRAFTRDSSTRVPTSGCYMTSSAPGNFAAANNMCRKFHNGYLAEGKTQNKTEFLENGFARSGPTTFWAGMSWDKMSQQYLWMDGSKVSSSSSYQPFSAIHSKGLDCVQVVVSSEGEEPSWQPTDCRNGSPYVCEAAPCDAVHYCTDIV